MSDGVCMVLRILTFTKLIAVDRPLKSRPSNIMMQILAPTGSEGPLADGENAFMQGDLQRTS